jgi:hypothetical protein
MRAYLHKIRGEEYDRIFSNYPVGFKFYPGGGLSPADLQTEPLNMESLYVFDKGLYNCRLYIDEIDQWLDRQEWMTTTQQILAKAIQLIRKRKMSIGGTIQSFQWLNSKFQFQTDIIVKCREAAFTPWGRERHLGMGEVSLTSWQDKSGVMTGYPYDERPTNHERPWQGERWWNCYDTTFEFDPMVTSTRYKMKRPTKTIIAGANGYEVVQPSSSSDPNENPQTPDIRDGKIISDRKERIDVLVAQAVDDFRTRDEFIINTSEMFEHVNELVGQDVDKNVVGSALRKMGVRRYGTGGIKYNLYPDEEKHGVDLGTKDQDAKDSALARLFDPTKHPGVRDLAGVT